MTLALCNDRDITKSERHVENAFRLVNHPVNLTPMWYGFLLSLDSMAPKGAMPSTSAPSVWSSATALKEVSNDRKNPIGYSEVMSLKFRSSPYRAALLVRTNFKTEHLTVMWSRVLYRARLFPPEG